MATSSGPPYGPAPAWLTAIAQAAPESADHRHPSVPTKSMRLLAEMTPDHRLGIPRLSDGSVGWSIPGATARVWPTGRIELRSTTGPVLAGHLEGSQWDQFQVAAVADAGLRLLCAPEAQHITRTGQPSGWSRPYDRPEPTGNGRERKGGQMYDGSTRSSCSCGWTHLTLPTRRPRHGRTAPPRSHRPTAPSRPIAAHVAGGRTAPRGAGLTRPPPWPSGAGACPPCLCTRPRGVRHARVEGHQPR
ncbi:hypothetical protein [Streptomyces sp. NPDC095817]|uniref:hypothetical protein n=1 Tax=Streptomyces sp. NPDC095817 TaxID=3155082 RepID=UPI00331A5A2A